MFQIHWKIVKEEKNANIFCYEKNNTEREETSLFF